MLNNTENENYQKYEYPQDFLTSILNHENGYLILADNPRYLRLGFACQKCGFVGEISLRDVRNNMDAEDAFKFQDKVKRTIASLNTDLDFKKIYDQCKLTLLEETKHHQCITGKQHIIDAYDSRERIFGYICVECNILWQLNLNDYITTIKYKIDSPCKVTNK